MKKRINVNEAVKAYDVMRALKSYRDASKRYPASEDSVIKKAEEKYDAARKCFLDTAQKLQAALDEVQKRSKARTIDAQDICRILQGVQDKVPTKKDLNGTEVNYDGAEHFPQAYKYRPESTHFTAEFSSGKWYITGIFRDTCPNRTSCSGTVNFSDAAKEAILRRMSMI